MKNLRFASRPRAKVRRQGPPGSARAQPWTCSDKFSFLVNCNPAEPQQSAKISLAHLTLLVGENKFSNEARPPPEAKLSPQNLSLLFFF